VSHISRIKAAGKGVDAIAIKKAAFDNGVTIPILRMHRKLKPEM
jgi:hypothetical protein